MAKKTKSLSQWCVEKMQSDILSELDTEKNFEVSVEFTMAYLAILQRFHLYSTYKGCYFNNKRSTFISSNEWRNTYE
ncbi:MAG: hypothetical protein IJA34_10440, partial [Lachnospiraceae bacterium]|nr:hypothetical protein [Lachnospiraceae bacterium]